MKPLLIFCIFPVKQMSIFLILLHWNNCPSFVFYFSEGIVHLSYFVTVKPLSIFRILFQWSNCPSFLFYFNETTVHLCYFVPGEPRLVESVITLVEDGGTECVKSFNLQYGLDDDTLQYYKDGDGGNKASFRYMYRMLQHQM